MALHYYYHIMHPLILFNSQECLNNNFSFDCACYKVDVIIFIVASVKFFSLYKVWDSI